MKRLTTGLLTVAATATAFALAGPAPAQASAPAAAPAAEKPARAESWGPYYSSNRRAYARGTVDYRSGGNYLVTSGGIRVRGWLYDRDYRTSGEGGMCAYAQIQGYRSGGYGGGSGWDRGRTYRHCGTNNYRTIDYSSDYASQARIRVCQVRQYGGSPVYCSGWRYMRDDSYGGYGYQDRPGYEEDRPGYAPSLSSYTPAQPKSSENIDDPNLIDEGVDSAQGQDHGQLPSDSDQPASGQLPSNSDQPASSQLPGDTANLPSSGYLPSSMQNQGGAQDPNLVDDESGQEGAENAPTQEHMPAQIPAQSGQAPAQTGQAPEYAPGVNAGERPAGD
ncbi:hypothetical protein GCM10010466_61240 [Planomonospora alba]|uniref:Uncharacterized protein n=1 Tax=Planomonospora alba TaxID=161354 RepID=A0ABP6NYX3_9ACTN